MADEDNFSVKKDSLISKIAEAIETEGFAKVRISCSHLRHDPGAGHSIRRVYSFGTDNATQTATYCTDDLEKREQFKHGIDAITYFLQEKTMGSCEARPIDNKIIGFDGWEDYKIERYQFCEIKTREVKGTLSA